MRSKKEKANTIMSIRKCMLFLKQIQSDLSDDETLLWCKGQKDLNVNYMDQAGHTPLTMAGSQGKIKTAILLIEMGANIYYKQPNGFNVFSAALHNGHFDMAQTMFYEYGFEIDSSVEEIVHEFNLNIFVNMQHVELFGNE